MPMLLILSGLVVVGTYVAVGVLFWLVRGTPPTSSRTSSASAASPEPARARGDRDRTEPVAGWSGPGLPDRDLAPGRSLPQGAGVRGTMQLLLAEDRRDLIVLDGYVVLEDGDDGSAPSQGPATLALSQGASTSFQATAARLRLQEWIDDGTVLDVEIHRDGTRVKLDVEDGTSTMEFEVASTP